MSITILCTGAPEHAIGGKYSSAGFDAAVQAERNSNIVPYGGRKHDPAGRTVLMTRTGSTPRKPGCGKPLHSAGTQTRGSRNPGRRSSQEPTA